MSDESTEWMREELNAWQRLAQRAVDHLLETPPDLTHRLASALAEIDALKKRIAELERSK